MALDLWSEEAWEDAAPWYIVDEEMFARADDPALVSIARSRVLWRELNPNRKLRSTGNYLDFVVGTTILFYHQTVADVSRLSPMGIRGGLPWEVAQQIAVFAADVSWEDSPTASDDDDE